MFLLVGGRIWIHIRMHRNNCGSGSGNAAWCNSILGLDPEPKHYSPREEEIFLDFLVLVSTSRLGFGKNSGRQI
jgi:hypothetical protein